MKTIRIVVVVGVMVCGAAVLWHAVSAAQPSRHIAAIRHFSDPFGNVGTRIAYGVVGAATLGCGIALATGRIK